MPSRDDSPRPEKRHHHAKLPMALVALRAGVAAIDRVAPGWAAAAVERAFLTPPRHPAPERERRALLAGESFSIPFRGGRLQAWGFDGAGPRVLLVHGWGGRGGQLASLVEPLRAAGFSPVVIDGPGHGRSSGRLASVPLFAEAIEHTARHLGGVRAVVGHSMGAASGAFALSRGLELDALVLIGAPRSPRLFLDGLSELLRLRPPVREAVAERLRRRFGVKVEDLELDLLAAGFSRTAALVVHDRDDASVPWSDGAAIAEAWPGGRMLTTEGLGHHRILRAPHVADAVAGFLADSVRPTLCECGRPIHASRRDRCGTCRFELSLFQPELRLA